MRLTLPLLLLLAGGLAPGDVSQPATIAPAPAADETSVSLRVERGREEVLVAAVERRFVSGTAKVSDAEVEEFYQAHRVEFAGSERIILRHLFRRLSVRGPEEAREAARAELEGLRREVLAGADFAHLAQTRSDSQSARFGGLIAPQARGQLEPSIEVQVWRLAVGELSEVVETPIGLHIFRLEQRLPPQNIDPATAREVSRRKLTFAALAAARERFFDQLVRESGAHWAPQRLELPPVPTALLFELGAERWTVADLERELAAQTFVERRTREPLDFLRERAEHALYLDKAVRARLADDVEVALLLAEAERDARIDDATEARLAERCSRLEDVDLRPVFDARPERFALPARHRLRILLRAFRPEHSPHHFFEELATLAGEIRAGKRDLAAAARELSSDPSGAAGGDLGWIDLRDFGWWAGTKAYQVVRELNVGDLSAPLLVETYDAAQLTDRVRGYVLVRVEAIEPRRERSFAEARTDVAAAWGEAHRPALRLEVEAEIARRTELLPDQGVVVKPKLTGAARSLPERSSIAVGRIEARDDRLHRRRR
ncbi:MAG: peptidylprolyl isomerase [Thermoanaerobaculia bacterium]